jgi:serine/threonine protein kinase/tetratricopeptide (TPR) repeat protein
MGVVYEALQTHPRRAVALKIMRCGIASEEVLRRFRHEAEFLGKLQHAGIAQIYEAGIFADGSVELPYFAMELIAGARSIVDYAKEEGLNLRQRLEYLAQVCDAVHYGHEHGVVHRDLKPGNILVNAEGQPRIIDFGVARGTNSDIALTTLQTDVGELIGTLQYMSPEQCAGDPGLLDRRADVYALGVVLYELVCQQLPYDLDRTPVLEALRTVRESTPVNPSTINRVLRGDVETIVLQALRKEKEERYQTAAALADDIRRFLREEAIQARPSSAIYHLRMFARRHRSFVGASISIVLLLMVGVSMLTYLITHLQESRRYADIASTTIKSLERYLRDTGSYPESSRSLIYLLTDDEYTAHRGRILILLPYTLDTAHRELLYLRTDGTLERAFSPPLELPQHPSFGSFSSPREPLLHGAVVGDLLAAHAGNEVAIAVNDEDRSPSVIQIWNLDLTGAPLAELWSMGHVQGMVWNETMGVLCVVARSELLPETAPQFERWSELETLRSADPSVLCGWRPQSGSHVLFPLCGTSEYPDAELDFVLVRVPEYEAELFYNETAYLTACLDPTPSASDSLCQVGIQTLSLSGPELPSASQNFFADVSKQGRLLTQFTDQRGDRLVDVTNLSEPSLIPLNLEVLRQAQVITNTLGDRLLDVEDADRQLQGRHDLPEEVRRTAIAMARLQFPRSAITAIESIVYDPDREKSDYLRALQLARQVFDLRPLDKHAQTALGLAQYRTANNPEKLQTALETLEKAERSAHSRPARVAAMALALVRIGRDDAARKALEAMEQQIKRGGPYVEEGQRLIDEARDAVGSTGTQPPRLRGFD